MFRFIVLALIALPIATLLSAIKISLGSRSLRYGDVASLMKAVPVSAHEEDDVPLAKADRLQPPRYDSQLPQAAVDALRRGLAEASAKLQQKDDDVVSWHWHEGSKVVRRRRSE